MTAEQYWDGDCTLVIYYREADKLRRQRDNETAWLQGMYIYDALARLSPILRAFAKKGTKPKPYVEEPYPIDKKQMENVQEQKEKSTSEKGMAYMQTIMARVNKQIEQKGSEHNADNNRFPTG